jgi:negative regulator of flagellin synthesis FlgM
MTTSKIEGGLPPPVRAAETAGNAAAQARAGGDRSQPVGAAPAADSLRLTGEAAGLQALQRELSGPPEVDLEKVNQVRAALADGSYKVDPQQIAERMLALESELSR